MMKCVFAVYVYLPDMNKTILQKSFLVIKCKSLEIFYKNMNNITN